jgi:hypothetical protein
VADGNGGTQIVGQLNIDMPYAGWLFAFSTAYISYGSGWTDTWTRLYIDGISISGGGGESSWVSATHSGGKEVAAGTHTVRLEFKASSKAHIWDVGIFVIGGFK